MSDNFAITIRNLKLSGKRGLFDIEKEVEQDFFLHVTLEISSKPFQENPELDNTIDYVKVMNICQDEFIQDFELLEEFLQRLSHTLKETFPEISSSALTIHKTPDLPFEFDDVAVTLRQRYDV